MTSPRFSHKFKILIGGSVLLLLTNTLLLFFFLQKDTIKEPQTTVVSIKYNEVSPSIVTISQGDTVIFKNISKNNHWIAANPHPTHESNLDFDVRRPIDPQESWEYTFTQAGTLNYHDHLNPTITGKIIVKNISDETTNTQNITSNRQSESQRIMHILTTQGPIEAWIALSQLTKEQLPEGHNVAHLIGAKLFDTYQLQSLDTCTPIFTFGCYHGVLEEFLLKEGVEKLPLAITQCNRYKQGILNTCFHGIGHGLLPHHHYDLAKSLSDCEKYVPLKEQRYCFSGIFMEYALVYNNKASKNNPLWPCTTVKTLYKETCYKYQMIYLTKLYGSDSRQIENTCMQTENSLFVRECITGYGHQLAQRNFANPSGAIKQCQSMESNQQTCLLAVKEELIFQGKQEEETNKIICSIIDNSNRSICDNNKSQNNSF